MIVVAFLCLLSGVGLYAYGYTYEGSVLAYMIGGIALCWPAYTARYTWWMTGLVMASVVPTTIWLQNKAVEVGLWGYPAGKMYLLGWITQAGDGPWQWTRHLWLGNEMPVMEYAFYPLFCLWQVTLYALYSQKLPDRWFEERHPRMLWIFPAVYGVITAAWVAAPFVFPERRVTDYAYWMMGFGFAITWAAWAWSPGFRTYSTSPAFWIWFVFVAVILLPLWEAFHIAVNRDWAWNIENTFPAIYTIRGASLPVHELFGYVTTATTFQALMFFYIRTLGPVVIKNRALVPFSDDKIIAGG